MQVQRYNGPVVSEIANMETFGELAKKFDWGVCRGIEACSMESTNASKLGRADEVGLMDYGWRNGIVRACPRIVKGAYIVEEVLS